MAKGHRKVTAQTRVKLSQAAKKRKRGLKGTSLGGKFMSSAHMSGAPTGLKVIGRNPDAHFTETVAQSTRADAERMARNNPERLVHEYTRLQTERVTGNPIRGREISPARVKVRSDVVKELETQRKEKNWNAPGTYQTANRKPVQKFVNEELAPSHKAKLEELLKDPNSNFNKGGTPGEQKHGGRYSPRVRNKLRLYTEQLQEGKSHDEAYQYLAKEHRGRTPTKRTSGPSPDRKTGRKTSRAPVRKSKYESLAPKANELQVGVSAGAVDKVSDLKSRINQERAADGRDPLPDSDFVRMQQTQRESVFDEMNKNVKWTHETRRANILTGSDKSAKDTEAGDRVVFFTTNLGGPAPSVPSDSLVGQYIIKKRAKMMQQAGVNKAQLRGEFPQAVRDMHLLEFSTGLNYGVEGRHGTYNETGWRYRNKSHGSLGKPTPVGSQVLYDSQGSPVYDKAGNLMYGEGATRSFKYNTPTVGLKIFIG